MLANWYVGEQLHGNSPKGRTTSDPFTFDGTLASDGNSAPNAVAIDHTSFELGFSIREEHWRI